jgi:methionyl-tRNA formyltransferase
VRSVLLANNRLGAAVGEYLQARGELVGLIMHPPAEQKHGERLAALAVPRWVWPDGFKDVQSLEPECLLSVLFGYLIPPEWLAIPTFAALNLHPGLLPWNGGAHPNVWPLVDGSPAGTTLHVMEPSFDTGAIVTQEAVETHAEDTAHTLYGRLEAASMVMFRRVWPLVRTIEPQPQVGMGSHHRLRDLATLDLSGSDLGVIDKLRARTFPPYGAEFERDGARFRARIEIERLG